MKTDVEKDFSMAAFAESESGAEFDRFLAAMVADIADKKKDPAELRSLSFKVDMAQDGVGRTITKIKVTVKLASQHKPQSFMVVGDVKSVNGQLLLSVPKRDAAA